MEIHIEFVVFFVVLSFVVGMVFFMCWNNSSRLGLGQIQVLLQVAIGISALTIGVWGINAALKNVKFNSMLVATYELSKIKEKSDNLLPDNAKKKIARENLNIEFDERRFLGAISDFCNLYVAGIFDKPLLEHMRKDFAIHLVIADLKEKEMENKAIPNTDSYKFIDKIINDIRTSIEKCKKKLAKDIGHPFPFFEIIIGD